MNNSQVFLHWLRGYLDCAKEFVLPNLHIDSNFEEKIIEVIRTKAEEHYSYDIEDSAVFGSKK